MARFKPVLMWAALTLVLVSLWGFVLYNSRIPDYKAPDVKITEIKNEEETEKASYIKWAEFKPTYDMLKKASAYDIESKGAISWIDLLAYSSAKSYGNINENSLKFIDDGALKLKGGEDLGKNLKYFSFYKEVYSAVLKEFIGKKGKDYGIIAFSPIADGFYYTHYNDFGNQRSYGFSRPHKGNDLLGSIGTPIIAVESGTVEALGWNNYGGWRIGIRSFDKKRYYYYAHLKKDSPFKKGLKEGDEVYAGQVIGYMGRTGYSSKENTNNVDTPHLHFGMELIFDESQKDSVNEIWIDVYALVKLLEKNKYRCI